jgi:hypothetical protein
MILSECYRSDVTGRQAIPHYVPVTDIPQLKHENLIAEASTLKSFQCTGRQVSCRLYFKCTIMWGQMAFDLKYVHIIHFQIIAIRR